jgi:hypothetical protein
MTYVIPACVFPAKPFPAPLEPGSARLRDEFSRMGGPAKQQTGIPLAPERFIAK